MGKEEKEKMMVILLNGWENEDRSSKGSNHGSIYKDHSFLNIEVSL
jgi:hypothetical protein